MQRIESGLQSLARVAHRFQISRQTLYKWLHRFRLGGPLALQELSRRPHRRPQALSGFWLERIEQVRRRYPRWGSKKIRAWLSLHHRRCRVPATSTIGAALQRLGLVHRRVRRPWTGGPNWRDKAPAQAQRCLDGRFQRLVSHPQPAAVRTIDGARSVQSLRIDGAVVGRSEMATSATAVCALVPASGPAQKYSLRQRQSLWFHWTSGTLASERLVDKFGHRGAIHPPSLSARQWLA